MGETQLRSHPFAAMLGGVQFASEIEHLSRMIATAVIALRG